MLEITPGIDKNEEKCCINGCGQNRNMLFAPSTPPRVPVSILTYTHGTLLESQEMKKIILTKNLHDVLALVL